MSRKYQYIKFFLMMVSYEAKSAVEACHGGSHNKINFSDELMTQCVLMQLPMVFLKLPRPSWTRWYKDMRIVLPYANVRHAILKVLKGHRNTEAVKNHFKLQFLFPYS